VDQTQLAQAVGGVRTGIGAALVVMPGVAGRIWIGPGAASPGAKVLARAVGARDLVLGLRTLETSGDRERAALWLHLGFLADAADVAAAVLAWRQLSPFRRLAVPLVAGGVGLAGYQAWRMVRHGDGEPSAAEVLGENLTEGGEAAVTADADGTPPPGEGASGGDGQTSPAGTGGSPTEIDESRLLSLEEAAEEIGSPPAQVMAMVEEGLLEPEAGTDPPQFRFGVVQAARLAGG
jgi:hypothetical protein